MKSKNCHGFLCGTRHCETVTDAEYIQHSVLRLVDCFAAATTVPLWLCSSTNVINATVSTDRYNAMLSRVDGGVLTKCPLGVIKSKNKSVKVNFSEQMQLRKIKLNCIQLKQCDYFTLQPTMKSIISLNEIHISALHIIQNIHDGI